MVLHHIDPWKQALTGDKQHLILLNQVPNYLHETYLLLVPFGLMGFHKARILWAVVNCSMCLISMLILGSYFRLGSRLTLLLALIFFSGYPFRQSLGYGQQDFFELLTFCCAFCLAPIAVRGIALGLSYVKYNFSPVFVFYLLFKKSWKIVLISMIPPLLGLLGVWIMVRTPLATLIVEPFMVSRNGVVVTAADVMALTRWLAAYVLPWHQVEMLSYLAGIVASAVYSFHLSKARYLSDRAVVACLATASIVMMRHGFYDFIFLVVPLANIKNLTRESAKVASALIFGFFWYGARISTLMSVNARMVLDIVLIAALLYFIESNDRLKDSGSKVPVEQFRPSIP
ncbi:hypothetical protein C7378_1455 [Acidipila rosea]|uniref:Uncharacterized protein n=2 Tax=Acidipila rosea TaxID=768535 RepID=A0A4R1LBH2_9BACT|nr:hypothetical protein C7378_1455 [Acidipila rosea]